MEGDAPSSAAAHYEAKRHYALEIDLVAALDFGQRLEHLPFAEPAPHNDVQTAVEIGRADRDYANSLGAIDKDPFGVLSITPVEPDEKFDGPGSVTRRRNAQSVRLN